MDAINQMPEVSIDGPENYSATINRKAMQKQKASNDVRKW